MDGTWDKHLDLANVASIYKKGDSSNLANYRPISLLQVFYKIIAALIKERLDVGLDFFNTKTQYGFRTGKSTAQAIFLARIILDISEQEGSNLSMILLDWEKAFDKISHEKLIEALERVNIPKNLLNLISNIYIKRRNSGSKWTGTHRNTIHKQQVSGRDALSHHIYLS